MIFRRRIFTIFKKELLEIMRDRRTVIGMVVVPVVLYPMLMLGFVWAAARDNAALQAETFTVEVNDAKACHDLTAMMAEVNKARGENKDQPINFEFRTGSTRPEALGDGVQLRFDWPLAERNNQRSQMKVMINFNEVNARSRTALHLMKETLRDFEKQLSRSRVSSVLNAAQHAAPAGQVLDALLHPVVIDQQSSATEQQRGGWALGQIVPIILVLMTITGAVYPAIDLTAGERERGTLETLMVTPVPTSDLILGKFFVVVTLSLLAALLNIASVGATMHFGGLTRALAQEMPTKLPLAELPIVLICMIPVTLLFSALMLAVASFARTFREAQNYVMPVIIGAMIPAAVSSLPGVQLRGLLLVMPVGNMVLLTRELFQGTYNWSQVIIVLLSTSLYAGAAVALATQLFGQEAVLFADAVSYKAMLQRRLFKRSARPSHSMVLLIAALLFPAMFYAQSLLADTGHILRMMGWLGLVQFVGFFVLMPLAVTGYFKIDVRSTFRLFRPSGRMCAAALCLGLSSWALAHEFARLQESLLPTSKAFADFGMKLEAELAQRPLWIALFLLAVLPAITEEFLFRGFLLSGLSTGMTKWAAMILAGAIFGLFHFALEKVLITGLLGVMLGYVCWQAGSIWPGMLIHAMHNGIALAIAVRPEIPQRLGFSFDPAEHGGLPGRVIIPALVLFCVGLLLTATAKPKVAGDFA